MSDLEAPPAADPADPTPNAGKAGLKLLLELGPLVLFFWLTKNEDILVATQAFLIAIAVASALFSLVAGLRAVSLTARQTRLPVNRKTIR